MVYLWTTAERSTSTLIIFVDSIGHRRQSCRKIKKTAYILFETLLGAILGQYLGRCFESIEAGPSQSEAGAMIVNNPCTTHAAFMLLSVI